MPRDYHLPPPHSQALLRAARSGSVFRPPPAPPSSLLSLEDEKEGAGGEEDEGGEGGEGVGVGAGTGMGAERGFVARKWGVVPRHLEGAEVEYLARRRKGLPSMYMGPVGGGAVGTTTTMGAMRKVKVRKTDAEGVAVVWVVLAPEGQAVEGEVLEDVDVDVEMREAPAPGTVVEGVGVVNAEGVVVVVGAGDAALMVQPTPPRRRPPPPRRKPKGPGRGRRKKVQFAPNWDGVGGTAAAGGSMDVAVAPQGGLQVVEGVKADATSTEVVVDGGVDAEMADDSLMQDGDEDDDDNDDGEEGEEGEGEGDDDDREEGELSPSPDPDAPGSLSGSPSKPPPPPVIEVTAARMSPLAELTFPPQPAPVPPISRDLSSSPELPLAASHANLAPLDEAPREDTESAGVEARQESEVKSSDGEVDLFGSLERHLEGRGNSNDQAEVVKNS